MSKTTEIASERSQRPRAYVNTRAAFFVIALTASTLGCHGSSSGARMREVRIALSKDPVGWLPVRLPQALGYYEKDGLAVTISEVAGLNKGIEALLGGSVDVAAETGSGTMELAAGGRPVQSFFVIASRPSFALIVSPASSKTIHQIADLRGHRVGVSSPGSPTHSFLNYLLVSHGLKPEEVSAIGIGTAGTSVAAVEHTQVDAAVLVNNAYPVLKRRYPEMTVLADTRSPERLRQCLGVDSFPSGLLVTQERWLKENPETARRFVRAVQRGMQWIAGHSPEEVRLQISEPDRMPDAEADRQSISLLQRAMTHDGRMPPNGSENIRKVLAVSNEKVRTGHLDLNKIYSNEFVDGH